MKHDPLFADVLLPLPVQQNFTYQVPEHLQSGIREGCRVIVQFGQRKLYTALVKKLHHQQPAYETKPVEILLDEEPVIGPHHFPFWEWMAAYYLCSEGEVMKAALPSGLKLESQTTITLNTNWVENERLSPTEEAIWQFLSQNHAATILQINKLTQRNNAYPVIKSLLKKGAIQVEEKVEEGYRPKIITHVGIAPNLQDEQQMEAAFDALKRAKKQLELFMWLLNEVHFYAAQKLGTLPKKEVITRSGASEGVLKGLVDKGYVELFEIETDRLPDVRASVTKKPLNQAQETGLNEIYLHFKQKNVVLLHGVTASGKTELYIRLIAEQLKAGKQVLYLLPEIALTSQIIDRLTEVFGNRAGVYHSKFNDAERVEIWNKVLAYNPGENNKYQLILGARSALFLPYQHLGLIIVDEEHESSFKQFDPAPRYHARDAAVMLGHLHHAKVLLGSATPSFESYFNAKAEKYGLVTLKQKHYNVAPPEVLVADLTDAYKRRQMKGYMTPVLFEAVETALQQNEQVILFQNRRGFAPFIQCRSCGWIPKCKQCDVSLTYHKFSNQLLCHYCGYSAQLPAHCSACGSADVQSKGFGTQKIEDELKIYFPEAKTDRLDLDAARTRQGFEKIIMRFTEGKTQVLIGTQMITKGLDFERVSVVGILNADNLLNYPDFRSFERAFQLMLQVSGRAGRKNKQGKVVIQTSQPDHPVISLVKEANFEKMFLQAMPERKLFRYPPWYRLINLTIKHKNRERAQLAARQLAQELHKTFQNRVLGPEFHLIAKIQLYYQLVIRIKLEKGFAPDVAKSQVMQAIEKVKGKEYNASVQFIPDVDPY